MRCNDCKDKVCLKTGKPCKKMEIYLRSKGIKSRDWIRPRVSPKKDEKDKMGRWREIPASHRIYDQFRPKDQ